MKRIFILLSAMLTAVVAGFAQSDGSELPESVQKTLQNCIWLMDNGMAQSAMEDFDRLDKEYPDNYVVQYERMYALYQLGRYDEVVKAAKKLLKNKDVTALVYHIYGNALDDMGKAAKARKIYSEGLKRFPDAGMLRLELGIMDMKEQKYNDALTQFERGIVATPSFASNYYRAAQILLSSDDRTWGLVYAEAAILLAPGNAERHRELAAGIRDTWKDVLSFKTENDTVMAKVTLVASRKVSVDEDGQTAFLAFPGIFEGCATVAAQKVIGELYPFQGSIAQLAALRKGIVETYFGVTDNLYGNSMYLLPFQKSVIDAGHWDAYNFFLFQNVCPDEFSAWYADNSDRLDAFIDWYNSAPFSLDASRTVSSTEIFRDYRKISLFDSFLIQAGLVTDIKKKEEE